MRGFLARLWSWLRDPEAEAARHVTRDQRAGEACHWCGRPIGGHACRTCGRPQDPNQAPPTP